jgi:acyl-CoA dehydrogenase
MTSTSPASASSADRLAKVQRIASEVARPHAASVDREARFPAEAVAALRDEGLLGAAVPREQGGLGCSITEVVAMCQTLGAGCTSTAMIFAMHQIQVACMARHGLGVRFFREYLQEIAARQLLVASGTSEVGVGGDMRSSLAAIERAGGRFRLTKSCSVMSYGEHADAVLITARQDPGASSGDQALALVRKGDYQLEKCGVWDTLGMRGTCSPPFKVVAEAAEEQILPQPFAEIASQTMVPYSHLVWSACWLGLASDAVATARSYLRQDARKRPGSTPFGSTRLVEAVTELGTMRSTINETAREYERLMSSPEGAETLSTVGYALRINNLKLTSSTMVAEIAQKCLGVCGVMGYAQSTKWSLGRHLRDALGAALMIANDRITATNASLLLVAKDE